MVEFAPVEVAGSDAEVAAEVGDGVFAGVEAEVGLLVLRIRAVAFEAAVRDDGADVAVEINRTRSPQGCHCEQAQDEGLRADSSHQRK